MPEKTAKSQTLKKPRYLGNRLPQHVAIESRQNECDLDKEYLVRALSHDVGAHLMILEYSFRQYDALAKKLAAKPHPDTKSEGASNEMAGEFRAMGGRIILRRDIGEAEKHVPHHSQRLRLSASTQGPDTLNEAASHVTACIGEMKRFVDELIMFAKTGNIDMEPSVVSIGELVDEVFYEQRGLLEERSIETVVSSPLPTVFANPLRVKQVLTNLVRNAALHGCDAEKPMIVIASQLIMDDEKMAAFSVWDNGPGIPTVERERIFEPGYRLSSGHNEGTGIGLAIARKVTSYYGYPFTVILCDEKRFLTYG